MQPEQISGAVIAKSRQQALCLEQRLVLDAAGIASDVTFEDGWWLLIVRTEDLVPALGELSAYRRENPPRRQVAPRPVPRLGGGWLGVLGYAAVLFGVAIFAGGYTFGADWITAGRMQASSVLDGEWWRCVTALTLHGDAGHITANLVFGAVFGGLAALAFGGGVAWLAILLGGAIGNGLNALIQSPDHLSLGASTAVFAALGLLVMHAFDFREGLREGWLRRWSPFVGGVLLLAYTGTGGERTDIMAHLTGFLAGLGLGVAAIRLPLAWLYRRSVQLGAAAAAIGLVLLAWGLALFGA